MSNESRHPHEVANVMIIMAIQYWISINYTLSAVTNWKRWESPRNFLISDVRLEKSEENSETLTIRSIFHCASLKKILESRDSVDIISTFLQSFQFININLLSEKAQDVSSCWCEEYTAQKYEWNFKIHWTLDIEAQLCGKYENHLRESIIGKNNRKMMIFFQWKVYFIFPLVNNHFIHHWNSMSSSADLHCLIVIIVIVTLFFSLTSASY